MKSGSGGAEKSREQVMAEREAKKLAKLQGKTKKPAGAKQPEKAENKKPEEIAPAAEASVNDVSAKAENLVVAEVTSSGEKGAEKTREEVLAERAAKKLEKKQGGKNKKNDENQPPVPTKSTEPLKPEIVQEKKDDSAEKSKAELRAERRAKQEAQRAKKADSKVEFKPEAKKSEVKASEKKEVVNKEVTPKPKKILGDGTRRVKLLSHLYAQSPFNSSVLGSVEDVHPSIARLGAQYRTRVVSGSNVRCLALLVALKQLIEDFRQSTTEDLSRGIGAELTKSMGFLNRCRPVSVSMTNAVKHLRAHLTKVKGSESEVKSELVDWIETYIKDQLEKAAEAISISVRQKIADGDVLLTYGYSSLIQKILTAAAKEGIKFRVVVVEGRPWSDGKELLRRLLIQNIPCTYILVNAISFIMPEVTKILLGAHALLANGYVMSRCGSSQIALMGRAMNVPVLVCCETHKFSERVQTDSFVYNELGNPDELVCGSLKTHLHPSVTSLTLMYDVTPPDLVSAVVTELAILPCTSVPVVLRIK